MRTTLLWIGSALLVLAIAGGWYVHGVTIPVLEPQGPVALQERGVIILTILLSAIVVIPVFVILFVFAWKYRADNPRAEDSHAPDWDHGNGAIEIAWWLVPTAIVAVLSVVAWQSSHELDPYKPLTGTNPPITIQVVALDWKWLFIYPNQGIASVNKVEFPENTPIRFELTADAPMNSFWIPSLGGQIMAMPGMSTQLNLMATSLGSFNGLSANISGDGFAGMTFTAQSVSQSDFNAWVASIQASSSSPLTENTYTALAAPSEHAAISYYAPIDMNLYNEVIMKFMMPENDAMSTMATSTGISQEESTSSMEMAPSAATSGTGMNMSMPMESASSS